MELPDRQKNKVGDLRHDWARLNRLRSRTSLVMIQGAAGTQAGIDGPRLFDLIGRVVAAVSAGESCCRNVGKRKRAQRHPGQDFISSQHSKQVISSSSRARQPRAIRAVRAKPPPCRSCSPELNPDLLKLKTQRQENRRRHMETHRRLS